MLRRLYDWTMALASGKQAPWALGGVSFAESSVFPIPPDILLIPMVLAERRKAVQFAALCTITSVLGGIFGYIIGAFLYEQVAAPILGFYGYQDKFADFADWFAEWGPWIVFTAGITPFPYKVITIASGAVGLAMPVFILASVLSRGIRFFAVAGLLYVFGPPIKDFIEKRLGLVFTIFVICLVGGFLAIKLL
ncbi:YqaA family protein [Coralliovum pocilloporae]|uniref:YqaA family protein n=1 Tax=Coralliovum pocilloporae TaxID=3066369 RepID=UPI00330766BD